MDYYKQQLLNKSEEMREKVKGKLKDRSDQVKEKFNNVSQNVSDMKVSIKNEGKLFTR